MLLFFNSLSKHAEHGTEKSSGKTFYELIREYAMLEQLYLDEFQRELFISLIIEYGADAFGDNEDMTALIIKHQENSAPEMAKNLD